MNDAAGQVVEQATYCQPGDEKRPQRVGLPDFTARDICPADISKGVDELTDAYPDGWYVRIMFDELLNPEIEDLTEIKDPDTGEGTDTYKGSIAGTKPVKLQCESVAGGLVDVPYDGYYSPSGNAVTWPLGPSLVIKPNDARTIATGKECTVTINDNVLDKSGEKVPADQRVFKFKVAPITVVSIDPSDDPDGTSPVDAASIFNDNFSVTFNTTVDPASFCDEGAGMDECEFSITPEDYGLCSTSGDACVRSKNGSDCPAPAGQTCDPAGYSAISLVPYGGTEADFALGPGGPVQTDHMYTFAFKAGTKLKDRCGVETTLPAPDAAALTQVAFKTSKFDIEPLNIGTGDTVSAMKKLDIPFSNLIDVASLDSTEFTISPTPTNFAVDSQTGADLFFTGFYKLGTDYAITIKKGATIKDVFGVTYTVPDDVVIMYKTQAAAALTTSSPADEATVTKPAPTSKVSVTLTFNQAMDKTSLVSGTDFTLTDSAGAAVSGVTVETGAAPNDCTEASTGCQLRVRSVLAAGSYVFTLKNGANITGVEGASYTASADKVIHFTVKEADVDPPVVCL